MRNLTQYANECMKMLDALHIKYAPVKAFCVNTRATGRWGICKKQGNAFIIEISSVLLDERNPEQALVETILHELLHTCYGCQNHGARWKSYAAKVNQAYGLNIKGRNSAEEKGIVVETRAKKIAHKFRCESCGAVVERQRESAFTKNYRAYRCSRCGGKFEKLF